MAQEEQNKNTKISEDGPKPGLHINAKSVASYALLPGILPRLRRIADHVSQFMFMFTQLFGAVGLIDKNHPCLKPENIGHYRFSDVIGLAASNVIFDRKHLPQNIMFFVILSSIVLTIAIILGFLVSVMFHAGTAHAQFFGTPSMTLDNNAGKYDKSGDWALLFLTRIFGTAGMFPEANGGNPWFTGLLQGMLKYYSMAMLVVASFMILYLLVITFVESARTGQPFGTRFDSIWAPIRLALAIGFLMPISTNGYNGAQMMVFQSAIWGSNLATNTWYAGINSLSSSGGSFFAASMTDPGYRFVRDIFLVNACLAARVAQNEAAGNDTDQEVAKPKYTVEVDDEYVTYVFGDDDVPDICGQVKLLKPMSPSARPSDLSSKVTWPEQTVNDYLAIAAEFLPVEDRGGIIPGIADNKWQETQNNTKIYGTGSDRGLVTAPSAMTSPNKVTGQKTDIQNFAKQLADKMIVNDQKDFNAAVKSVTGSSVLDTKIVTWVTNYWSHLGRSWVKGSRYFQQAPYATEPSGCGKLSGNKFVPCTRKGLTEDFNTWVVNGLKKDAVYGWATAGVFYLRMSNAMSMISKVTNNPPKVSKLPSTFMNAFATDANPDNDNDFDYDFYCKGFSAWAVKAGNYIAGAAQGGTGAVMAAVSNEVIESICTQIELSGKMNTFLTMGNAWFTKSVKLVPADYNMLGSDRYDHELAIVDIHSATNNDSNVLMQPIVSELYQLAQISSTDLNPLGAVISWGAAMMNIAYIAYAMALGSAVLGVGLTSLALTVGNAFLIPGFILMFWIPMTPFMHFTFAVMEWMISVLEAVIGMPLWALTLISLEGDGLGRGIEGVKRLFELVLRPTVIVMALLASMIIFGAAIGLLNDAIQLYASAYSSSKASDGLFQSAAAGFGMVFVYMFAVYSLANSSFKLINNIPDTFGRWAGLEKGFGSEIKAGFGEIDKVIAGGLLFNAMQKSGESIIGGTEKMSKGIKGDIKAGKEKKAAALEKQAEKQELLKELDSRYKKK